MSLPPVANDKYPKEPTTDRRESSETRYLYDEDKPQAVVDPTAVVAALNALLADSAFQTSARNKKFLRFVVEETLAGRGQRIKSYTIAVDVFGRPADFDGSLDPIVRIEASRLRAALTSYYSNPAVNPEVRISMPKGGYQPQFAAISRTATFDHEQNGMAIGGAPATDHAASDVPMESTVQVAPSPSPMRPGRIDADTFVRRPSLPRRIAGSISRTLSRKPLVEGPVLFVDSVDPLTEDEPTRLLARTIGQSLISALGQYDGISVSRKPQGGDVALDKLLKDSPHRTFFQLSCETNLDHANVRLWWSLSDMRTMEVYRSVTEEGPWRTISGALLETEIAENVAVAIAHCTGLVKTIAARAFLDPYAPGYPAVLQAQRYILSLDPEAFALTRKSLERTVELTPEYAEAWAYLGYIYACETRQGPGLNRSFDESIALARRAVTHAASLAPFSALTQFATMVVKFQEEDDAGFDNASEACLRMSPSDPKMLLAIGNRRWAMGRWEEGIAMIRRAVEISRPPGPSDESALALDFYRRQDYAEALAISLRIPASVHTAAMIVAASYGQLGDGDAAQPYIRRLLQLRPHFAREMRTEFRNFRTGYMADHFADGLRKAGLNVSDEVIPKDQKPGF
jgi:adenylate cyclase